VLAVLRSGPLHGYGIVQEIASRTDGLVGLRPGNLYRVLDRMLDAGLLEVAERRPARELDDERRTYYRITALGRRVVIAEAELLAPIVADVIGVRTFRPA
jgi:DNA-binding PadR family transcriptional regulator